MCCFEGVRSFDVTCVGSDLVAAHRKQYYSFCMAGSPKHSASSCSCRIATMAVKEPKDNLSTMFHGHDALEAKLAKFIDDYEGEKMLFMAVG